MVSPMEDTDLEVMKAMLSRASIPFQELMRDLATQQLAKAEATLAKAIDLTEKRR